ncbi:PEGA domain-containing protein [Butyrivibrio sp. X503]|uniref:PEGA domain-containing protein n=1 Tax=Butyrivibrio sp. X503 TaxID=2364878 RepID=UPI001314F8C2|nr:PEGA domain-containing protein [Butyrivibrio sp. X503]
MKKNHRIIETALAVAISFAMLTPNVPGAEAFATANKKISISMIGKYDSADTAAIRDIDLDSKKIRFRNHATGRTYTLDYDNTSMMYDARENPLSPSLLEIGQVVDVKFLKSTKHITSLVVSKDAWTIEDTRDHELVRADKTAKVKGELYKMDTRALVMAEGEPALAEDVLGTDKIKVYGVDNEIYSVVVTSGHGYVSLSSDTVEDRSLVGAWLELDNEVIYKISPNMMLSAPEGEYNLQILGNGANYQSKVSISRNKETVVDTSDITISKPKEGLVTFEITPSEAEVYVDGEKQLTDVPVSIRYGYHALKIMADGYITQNRYLKVGTAKSVVQIELEKEDSGSSKSSSSAAADYNSINKKDKDSSSSASVATIPKSSAASSVATVSANSDKPKDKNRVIEGYKIYVEEPEDTEVYFDGSYIGMTPAIFTKVSGTHEVTLRRDGYKTKSYRVNVDDSEDNTFYKFPELKKEEKESENDEKSDKPSDAATNASTQKPADASKAKTADEAAAKVTTKPDASSVATTKPKDSSATATTDKKDDSSTTATTDKKGDSSDKDKTDSGKEEATNPSDHGGKTNTEEGTDGSETGSSKDKKDSSDAANTASGENQ